MKIISVNNYDGMVTYEIDHPGGTLREQLSVADFKTTESILARISEREKQVAEEINARRVEAPEIPAEITAMADLVING